MKIPTPDEMPMMPSHDTRLEVDRMIVEIIDQLRYPKKVVATARGSNESADAVAALMRQSGWVATVRKGGARDSGTSSLVMVTRPPTPMKARNCKCAKDGR